MSLANYQINDQAITKECYQTSSAIPLQEQKKILVENIRVNFA